VVNTHYLEYADGSPFYAVGTTAYQWTSVKQSVQERTVKTLAASPFNKMRMCVFPKSYSYGNTTEPWTLAFKKKGEANDPSQPNYEFFQNFDKRVRQLMELGIQADVILFHPYDRWGYCQMGKQMNERYVRNMIARLSAYRNVWWSLANEFDFMKEKTNADWERFIKVVGEADPYRHLLSNHNGTRLFNHTDPRITHASIQNGSAVADFGRAILFRDVYRKPIVFDEVKYEGDFEQRWGNLSAEEMVHRFWQGTIAGTYVGHGETYKHPDDVVWWSKGGTLRGNSPKRIDFLRKVLEDGPKEGLEPIDKWQDERTAGKKGEYYLVYFGKEKPDEWTVDLPRAGIDGPLTLTADVLDTWNMTAKPVSGTFTVKPNGRYRLTADPPARITLPGTPYMAIRLRTEARKK
jgi:hypothetical protein